jgi:hypothetical protein
MSASEETAKAIAPTAPCHGIGSAINRTVAMAGTDHVALPHGFTLASLDRVAGISARGSLRRSPPHAEKVDLTRFAILEHLYQWVHHVDTDDVWHLCNLPRIGQRAIDDHAEQQDLLGRLGDAVADDQVHGSPEEPVVEALAFRQIWPLLEASHQQALLALAKHPDFETAAQTSGIAYHLMVMHVYEARRTFLAHWHDKPSARIPHQSARKAGR